MRMSICVAVSLAAGGLALASVAVGGPINCVACTIPAWIRVTGFTANNLPDPDGLYCVTIRDFANNRISGVLVRLDFSACCDLNVCSDAVSGQTVESCAPPVISAITDGEGVA